MKKITILMLLFAIVVIFFASCKSNPVETDPTSSSSKNESSKDEQNSSQASEESSELSSLPSSEVSSEMSSVENSSTEIVSSKNQSSAPPKPPASSKPSSQAATSGFTWDKGGNYTGAIQINLTSSPKITVLSDERTIIDISNASDGYITASHTGSSQRLKFQVIKDGRTYNYDLNNSGYEEVFPLQMGNGSYQFRVMENVSGSSYVQVFSETTPVSLSNGFSPFLLPSQYVNYNASSATVKKSFDLSINAKTDLDKVKSVYNTIITTIKYDSAKAQSVQSGYLPNVDSTLSSQRGICFDYAALMAAMLRAQNVPTKLVVGEVAPNGISHAWNEVYIQNQGWITIGIQADGSSWKRLDATFGASNQKDIANFIGNGSNYTALRIY